MSFIDLWMQMAPQTERGNDVVSLLLLLIPLLFACFGLIPMLSLLPAAARARTQRLERQRAKTGRLPYDGADDIS